MVRPPDRFSVSRRNSSPSGWAPSMAITRRQSLTGRPDLMPRTTMSMALGSSAVNFLCRPLQRAARNQRGRPKPTTKPAPSAIIGLCAATRPTPAPTTANTAHTIQKWRTLIDSPACWMRESRVSLARRSCLSAVLRFWRICLRRVVAASAREGRACRSALVPAATAATRLVARAPPPPPRAAAREGQAQARQRHEAEHGDEDEQEGRVPLAPTPPRPGLRPARAPARNSAPGPRSAAGLCRWSGGAPPRAPARPHR